MVFDADVTDAGEVPNTLGFGDCDVCGFWVCGPTAIDTNFCFKSNNALRYSGTLSIIVTHTPRHHHPNTHTKAHAYTHYYFIVHY